MSHPYDRLSHDNNDTSSRGSKYPLPSAVDFFSTNVSKQEKPFENGTQNYPKTKSNDQFAMFGTESISSRNKPCDVDPKAYHPMNSATLIMPMPDNLFGDIDAKDEFFSEENSARDDASYLSTKKNSPSVTRNNSPPMSLRSEKSTGTKTPLNRNGDNLKNSSHSESPNMFDESLGTSSLPASDSKLLVVSTKPLQSFSNHNKNIMTTGTPSNFVSSVKPANIFSSAADFFGASSLDESTPSWLTDLAPERPKVEIQQELGTDEYRGYESDLQINSVTRKAHSEYGLSGATMSQVSFTNGVSGKKLSSSNAADSTLEFHLHKNGLHTKSGLAENVKEAKEGQHINKVNINTSKLGIRYDSAEIHKGNTSRSGASSMFEDGFDSDAGPTESNVTPCGSNIAFCDSSVQRHDSENLSCDESSELSYNEKCERSVHASSSCSSLTALSACHTLESAQIICKSSSKMSAAILNHENQFSSFVSQSIVAANSKKYENSALNEDTILTFGSESNYEDKWHFDDNFSLQATMGGESNMDSFPITPVLMAEHIDNTINDYNVEYNKDLRIEEQPPAENVATALRRRPVPVDQNGKRIWSVPPSQVVGDKKNCSENQSNKMETFLHPPHASISNELSPNSDLMDAHNLFAEVNWKYQHKHELNVPPAQNFKTSIESDIFPLDNGPHKKSNGQHLNSNIQENLLNGKFQKWRMDEKVSPPLAADFFSPNIDGKKTDNVFKTFVSLEKTETDAPYPCASVNSFTQAALPQVLGNAQFYSAPISNQMQYLSPTVPGFQFNNSNENFYPSVMDEHQALREQNPGLNEQQSLNKYIDEKNHGRAETVMNSGAEERHLPSGSIESKENTYVSVIMKGLSNNTLSADYRNMLFSSPKNQKESSELHRFQSSSPYTNVNSEYDPPKNLTMSINANNNDGTSSTSHFESPVIIDKPKKICQGNESMQQPSFNQHIHSHFYPPDQMISDNSIAKLSIVQPSITPPSKEKFSNDVRFFTGYDFNAQAPENEVKHEVKSQPQQQFRGTCLPISRLTGATASFGFGGLLIISRNKNPIHYKARVALHSLLHIVPASSFISDVNNFPGPADASNKAELVEFAEKKADLNSGEPEEERILWAMVHVALRFNGKFVYPSGASDPLSPGAAIVAMLKESHLQDEKSLKTIPKHVEVKSLTVSKKKMSISLKQSIDADCLKEVESRWVKGDTEGAVEVALAGEKWGLAIILASQSGINDLYKAAVSEYANVHLPIGSSLHGLVVNTASTLKWGFNTHPEPDENTTGKSWKLKVVDILLHSFGSEAKSRLLEVGDQLRKEKGDWKAAHIVYLAAGWEVQKPHRGARLVLPGLDHTLAQHRSLRTCESTGSLHILEVLEVAQGINGGSLVQGHKLRLAMLLADLGLVDQSIKYLDSIVSKVSRSGSSGGPYTEKFISALEAFGHRLYLRAGKREEDRKYLRHRFEVMDIRKSGPQQSLHEERAQHIEPPKVPPHPTAPLTVNIPKVTPAITSINRGKPTISRNLPKNDILPRSNYTNPSKVVNALTSASMVPSPKHTLLNPVASVPATNIQSITTRSDLLALASDSVLHPLPKPPIPTVTNRIFTQLADISVQDNLAENLELNDTLSAGELFSRSQTLHSIPAVNGDTFADSHFGVPESLMSAEAILTNDAPELRTEIHDICLSAKNLPDPHNFSKQTIIHPFNGGSVPPRSTSIPLSQSSPHFASLVMDEMNKAIVSNGDLPKQDQGSEQKDDRSSREIARRVSSSDFQAATSSNGRKKNSYSSSPVPRDAKNPPPRNGSIFRRLISRFAHPDAKIAHEGEKMEAYYDKDKKRWIFPGEEDAPDPEPLLPPPTGGFAEPLDEMTVVDDDPLAALMAPPDPLSLLMAPPNYSIGGDGGGYGMGTLSSHKPREGGLNTKQTPPTYAVFIPKQGS